MTILRQDIEQIRGLAGRIKGERDGTVADLIQRLHGINNELNAAWDGASQTAFFDAYGNWIAQLEEFSNTMYSVEQYLTSVANNFEELDQAAAAAATGAATRT
ncbi:MAG TPA: WXG100 family type VII secretion target [Anaerolineales bacterium]|nr:WXG100 family type VII secretion target [Anaerolineales bacterium]